jgi:dethiobiotin synthetase
MNQTAPHPATKSVGLFVTGTDTGIGKTYVAERLIRGFAAAGWRTVGMKPIAAGTDDTADGPRNDDALALAQAGNVDVPYELTNPYALPMPVSPHLAARRAGVSVDLDRIRAAYRALAERADVVIVEGAGGWHAPLSDKLSMADLARGLQIPALLVVGMRLGCLNHALLTAQAIEASGVADCGWIANRIDPHMLLADENIATLEQRFRAAPLAIVEHSSNTISAAAQAAGWTKVARALAQRTNLIERADHASFSR